MKLILLTIAIISSLPAWAEIEQPNYKVILEKGIFAIRDYTFVMAVETEVFSSRREAAGDAFPRLFRYISGENEDNLEISMTSPVTQTLANQNDDDSAERWIVRFFIPKNMAEENIPLPSEKGVTVSKLKAQRFASVSFRGSQSDKKIEENKAKLKAFITQNGYEVSGRPIYAFYDPPFIPWFLRDNEILLPVKLNQKNAKNPGDNP
ncbi:MAG: heme-binding protein [Pseudomonadota bacterium]|nr:heme-binding protein [Pseudomonadota bacterium]